MTAAPALVDQDWNHLRSQVRRMLGSRLDSRADAEDVVQEILLRVLRNASSLRDGARFDGWLATMVRNAVADQHRGRQRHPLAARDADEGGEGAPDSGEGSEEAARNQVAAALRPFAERLPALYRDVIIMSELEGIPHAEIGRRLAISVSGVKSRVQRGREQLRRMLNECCEIALDARRGVIACVPKSAHAERACACASSRQVRSP